MCSRTGFSPTTDLPRVGYLIQIRKNQEAYLRLVGNMFREGGVIAIWGDAPVKEGLGRLLEALCGASPYHKAVEFERYRGPDPVSL